MDSPSTPGAPLFALTFSHASQTARCEISNGLPGDFSPSTRLLPENFWLIERTRPRTTRPLRSAPITGASALLQAGPPAHPATVLSPLRHQHRLERSLSPARTSRPGSIGTRLLLFHTEAADRARVVYMPDTAWPVSGHPPGSSRDSQNIPVSMSAEWVSTRQQRFACARLPGPHLTPLTTPFPHRSPRRSSANAACGGLKPPPAGRLRRAYLHHSRSTAFQKAPTYIRTSLPAFVAHRYYLYPDVGRVALSRHGHRLRDTQGNRLGDG